MLVLLMALIMGTLWPALGARISGERLARIEASDHYRQGQFVNLQATSVVNPGNFAEFAREYLFGGQEREPEPPPLVPVSTEDFSVMPLTPQITWFGHSTLLIELDGKRYLTDPVFSLRCSPSQWIGPKRFFPAPIPIDQLPNIDYVLISHDHYDHLDEQSIRALIPKTNFFAVPLGVGAHLELWGVPARKIIELDWWQEHQSDADSLLAFTPSRHFSGRRLSDRNKTLWGSWVIKSPHKSLYFSGDTGFFPGFAEIGERYGPFDLVFLEVGAFHPSWATVHLGTENAVKAMSLLRSEVLFPIHWGTFNLALHGWTEPMEELLELQAKHQFRLLYATPGKRVAMQGGSASDYWWRWTESSAEKDQLATSIQYLQ